MDHLQCRELDGRVQLIVQIGWRWCWVVNRPTDLYFWYKYKRHSRVICCRDAWFISRNQTGGWFEQMTNIGMTRIWAPSWGPSTLLLRQQLSWCWLVVVRFNVFCNSQTQDSKDRMSQDLMRKLQFRLFWLRSRTVSEGQSQISMVVQENADLARLTPTHVHKHTCVICATLWLCILPCWDA